MDKPKFSDSLNKELVKQGRSKTWLSKELPMKYDTLLSKFRKDSFKELEINRIKQVLGIDEEINN